MLAQLLTATAVAAVPKVAAGPDLARSATAVDAPIDRVEVFSDRARVTRRGVLTAKPGVLAVRLPDLPGAAWLDTLRAQARGATVLRVEAIPVQRERISIDQVETLLVKLEAQTDEIARLDAEIAARTAQLQAVSGLRPKAPIPEEDRRGPVRWAPSSWARVLDFFSGLRAGIRAETQALEIQRRGKWRALEKTQREVQNMSLGAFSDQKVQVVLLMEAKRAGKASVTLTYDVPGAFWKPAYDLHFDAKKGTVALETYGVVQQATGESWDDVELALSTSIPGRDIALPELLTWTLGEAKEFIPRPRPRRRPPTPPRYPAPAAGADREQVERQARLSLLQRRLSELNQLSQVNVRNQNWFQPSVAARAKEKKKGRRRPPPRPRPSRSRARSAAPQAMPAPVMEMDDAPVSMSAESTRSSGSGLGDAIGGALGSVFAKKKERVRSTPLDLFEARSNRGPRFSDPDLPAVSAAGFEYQYRARTRITVPSTNQSLRAPLGRSTYPVTAFYEAAPALAKNAYLKATVKNPGPQPILRGPVTIFVNGGFAGDGRLQTTAPGGTLALPFGADEDIELVYQVVPKTETKGVFGKDEVTTYRVMMQVANYKKRPVSVVLREPLPRSKNEDIEIDLVKTSVKPDSKDDGNVLQWTVTIAPGRTQSVELVYRIRRPEGWQLQQR